MTKQRIKNTLLNRCKCCLRERPSKDMWDEHIYHGGTENYGILLTNCFQLPWHEPLSGMERICFLCIGRLRDAVSFKSQIMEAQKFKLELLNDAMRLHDVADIEQKIQEFHEKNLNITVAFERHVPSKMLRPDSYFEETNPITNTGQEQYEDSMYDESMTDEHDNPKETDNNDEGNTNIPIEYIGEEYLEMETGIEKETTNNQQRDIQVELVTQVSPNNPQVIILGNTIITKKNKETKTDLKDTKTTQNTVTEIAAESEPTQDSTHEPDMSPTVNHDDNSTLADLNENDNKKDNEQAKRSGDRHKRTWNKYLKKNYLIERTKHQVNLAALLLSTDATPIKVKTDKGYQCGFCQTHYYDPNELRSHTHETHGKQEKATYMAETPLSALIVRLDITDLHCVQCYTSLEDLDTAWSHLQDHGNKIHMDIKNQIAPFKFKGDNLECVVCHANMTFRGLLKHMNSHSRNVVCEQCGDGFINKRLLDTHALEHKEGHYQCEHCSKHFKLRKQLTIHTNHVHVKRKALRIVCGICGDRFSSGLHKMRHLKSVHKAPVTETVTPLPQCPQCGKVLSDKKTLRKHVLNVHQKLKRFQCEHCDKECFDITTMKRHVQAKHLKYAGLECPKCSKAFRSKKQLICHMRYHEVDKIYNCKYCSEIFLTSSGRQSHLRSKHESALVKAKTKRNVKYVDVNVNSPEEIPDILSDIEELS